MSEPTDYVVGHHLNEGSGTSAANSGSASGWNLAADGTITWVTGPGAGTALANAVNFSGSAHLESGTGIARPFAGNACTLAAYARIDDNNDQQTLAMLGTFTNGVYIQPWSDGRIYGGFTLNGAYHEVSTSYAGLVADGQFHKFVVVIEDLGSSNRVRFYIDDNLVGSVTTNQDLPVTLDRFIVGASSTAGAHRLDGQIAATRFYGRVLESSERAELFLDSATANPHATTFITEFNDGALVNLGSELQFPYGRNLLEFEILLDGVWVDITEYIYREGPVTVQRGVSDEAQFLDPCSTTLILNNRDGRFSIENPLSPYYGELSENTPLRIAVIWNGARHYRFHGEVASWPTRWNAPGTDIWVPIEVNGVTRRLGQGSSPRFSSLRRLLTSDPTITAYWPAEDQSGSNQLASGLPYGKPMAFHGEPQLASYGDFECSLPVPALADIEWRGNVIKYSPTGQIQVRFLYTPGSAPEPNQGVIAFQTTGTAAVWGMQGFIANNGEVALRSFAEFEEETMLVDSTRLTNTLNKRFYVSIELQQSGTSILWRLALLDLSTEGGGVQQTNGTLSNRVLGRVRRVRVNPGGGQHDGAVGHISVSDTISSISDIGNAVTGHKGEPAGRRIERLCAEHNIEFTAIGDLDDTALCGPEPIGTFLDVVKDAAIVDRGILFEPADSLGLGYRTLASMFNQTPAFEIDYPLGILSPPLEPIKDDQGRVNDVTITRQNGSSFRAEIENGMHSIQDPPDGVGRYTHEETVNAMDDVQLPDLAGWFLHISTTGLVTRYPVVTIDLSTPVVAETLTPAILASQFGDLVTIDNLPAFMGMNLVKQLIYGYEEQLSIFEHVLRFNMAPAYAYEIKTYETSRVNTSGTVLAEALTTTETGADVTTTVGPRWADSAAHASVFPFDIVMGGERCTVTAITGTTTSQTMTLIRSVNGIVKEHAVGTPITLAEPTYRALGHVS